MDISILEIINKIFYWTYARPLWQIVIFEILAIVIWSILAYKFAHNKVWRIINIIGVVCIVLAIIYLTIIKRSTSDSFGVYLLPSENFNRAVASKSVVESIHLNILLFFPLGLFLPFALPDKFKHKVIITLVACFLFSLSIEVIQGIFSIGDVEIFDLIMNSLGGAIGSIAYGISKYSLLHKINCNK